MKAARDAPRALVSAAIAASAVLAGCAPTRDSKRDMAQRPYADMFYSDLGPDEIDVSGYPSDQQRNYKVYAQACSECHSLARSINSPVASREFWEMYAQAMRRRSYFMSSRPMSRQDVDAIVDFLEYDSMKRKIALKDQFDRQTKKLKRRFNALIDEQVQKSVSGSAISSP